jgi:hypothetical protein
LEGATELEGVGVVGKGEVAAVVSPEVDDEEVSTTRENCTSFLSYRFPYRGKYLIFFFIIMLLYLIWPYVFPTLFKHYSRYPGYGCISLYHISVLPRHFTCRLDSLQSNSGIFLYLILHVQGEIAVL